MDAHHEYIATSSGLVTAKKAFALGYTRAELRRLHTRQEMAGLRRGIYLSGPLGEGARQRHLDAAAAALLAIKGNDAALAHRTAAVVWDLDWLEQPDLNSVWLIQPPSSQSVRSYPGLHVWPATLPAHHLTISPNGLPTTTPARAVVDIARHHSFREAVVAGESALRYGLANNDELRTIVGDCRGWPFVRKARRVVELIDGTTQSVAEALARAIFAEQGLPLPRTQVEIRDAAGSTIGYVDFLFARWVVVEVDGRKKYDDPEVLWAEKRREDRLWEAGYEVVRLTWADLMGPAEAIVRRVLKAMDRATTRHP
ncbi:MAG: hypothetical protein ACT4QF_21300 [Sporichthyaceae bacterium]